MIKKYLVIGAISVPFLLVAGLLHAQEQTQAAAVHVGWETCAGCHDDIADGFDLTIHGRLAMFERPGEMAGCEGCHGPGSLHADSGDPELITTFRTLSGSKSAQVCLDCHEKGTAMEWMGSTHAINDVACTDCHGIHVSRQIVVDTVPTDTVAAFFRSTLEHPDAPQPKSLLKDVEALVCFDCHQDQMAQFSYSSHHPVREGHMTCSDCHSRDGAIHGNTPIDFTTNERCLNCHPQHEGPWIFEHAPVEEDCTACHNAHGAVADNLLVQNEPFLCMTCHEQHFHGTRAALDEPYYIKSGGSDNTQGRVGFMAAFNTRCTPCHIAIHGSDLPSLSITGRGGALIR